MQEEEYEVVVEEIVLEDDYEEGSKEKEKNLQLEHLIT